MTIKAAISLIYRSSMTEAKVIGRSATRLFLYTSRFFSGRGERMGIETAMFCTGEIFFCRLNE
jgi:hypothetical protein